MKLSKFLRKNSRTLILVFMSLLLIAFLIPDTIQRLSGPDPMDKIVVDDWGQCRPGTGKFGCLRRHVESGKLSEKNLHGELCDIVAGKKPGRANDSETILFWHRGLSLSDIALGHAMLEKAGRLGVGQKLRYA